MEELNWESRVLGSVEKCQAWVSGSSQAERALRERLHMGMVGHHRLLLLPFLLQGSKMEWCLEGRGQP